MGQRLSGTIPYRRGKEETVKKGMLLLILMMAQMLPACAWAQNYSGQWLGRITESQNRCQDLGKAEPGDYKLTIVHKDDAIMLMENVVQRPYRGSIDPQRPQKARIQGAYNVDGGYVAERIDIEFANERQGSGHSVWNWSDGYYQCGGRFAFELTLIRK